MEINAQQIAQIKQLVLETGEFIRREAAGFSPEKVERKGANDLVSYVDKNAEKQLTEGCLTILPGSGFIREEGGELKGTNPFRWIIDPLDGTTNFVHGVPQYSISLALQYEEETILGIVYDVARDELFMAQKGKGAFLNGSPIHVSDCPNLGSALMATGFPYNKSDRNTVLLAVLYDILQQVQAIRRFGSAALDMAWVACGRFDGYYETTLNPWDIAAGILLVEEAGGRVTDFSGGSNTLFGRQIAACNPRMHPDLLGVIQAHFS
ncbi:MAG: inositol monophosphatase [Bacteroidia bacterium]|nr:inositol monophosphatase [Bacteroidia bacterium]